MFTMSHFDIFWDIKYKERQIAGEHHLSSFNAFFLPVTISEQQPKYWSKNQ